MATYPKTFMTIKELVAMGYTRGELMRIYRNRAIQRDYRIASKKNPAKETSAIVFDTEALEKYRKSQCTGV